MGVSSVKRCNLPAHLVEQGVSASGRALRAASTLGSRGGPREHNHLVWSRRSGRTRRITGPSLPSRGSRAIRVGARVRRGRWGVACHVPCWQSVRLFKALKKGGRQTWVPRFSAHADRVTPPSQTISRCAEPSLLGILRRSPRFVIPALCLVPTSFHCLCV